MIDSKKELLYYKENGFDESLNNWLKREKELKIKLHLICVEHVYDSLNKMIDNNEFENCMFICTKHSFQYGGNVINFSFFDSQFKKVEKYNSDNSKKLFFIKTEQLFDYLRFSPEFVHEEFKEGKILQFPLTKDGLSLLKDALFSNYLKKLLQYDSLEFLLNEKDTLKTKHKI